MIYLTITAGLVIIALTVALCYILHMAREERRDLEDRLMAVTQPIALVQHHAQNNNEPGTVTYVGEGLEEE